MAERLHATSLCKSAGEQNSSIGSKDADGEMKASADVSYSLVNNIETTGGQKLKSAPPESAAPKPAVLAGKPSSAGAVQVFVQACRMDWMNAQKCICQSKLSTRNNTKTDNNKQQLLFLLQKVVLYVRGNEQLLDMTYLPKQKSPLLPPMASTFASSGNLCILECTHS